MTLKFYHSNIFYLHYQFAHRFGVDLDLYVKLFELILKAGIPKGNEEWIAKRVDIYEQYRKLAVFDGTVKKGLKQAQKRRDQKTMRADKLLMKVKNILSNAGRNAQCGT